MKLIVGLGNPGSVYENTYHNIGFMAIDKLCEKVGGAFDKAKFHSIYCKTKINDEVVYLQKPLTYMNNSGVAVKEMASYFDISPENVIVFCDDIDLDKGVSRLRTHGSAGTHNDLKSIVHFMGEDFVRIKIGAGNNKNIPLVDYVLSKIDNESMDKINSAIDEGIEKLFGLF